MDHSLLPPNPYGQSPTPSSFQSTIRMFPLLFLVSSSSSSSEAGPRWLPPRPFLPKSPASTWLSALSTGHLVLSNKTPNFTPASQTIGRPEASNGHCSLPDVLPTFRDSIFCQASKEEWSKVATLQSKIAAVLIFNVLLVSEL